MFKTNARAAPVCHACYNARRAIIGAVSKNPEAKRILLDMQANDPELWKAKVRSCRIIDDSDGDGDGSAVRNKAQRVAQILRLVSTLRQTIRMKEVGGVMWLNEPEFINHMVTTQRKTEEQAVSMWKDMLANPSIKKMKVGGDESRVPVIIAPRTEVERERSISTEIAVSSNIETSKQAQDALGQLSNLGAGAATLSAPTFGDMGSVFRAGGAA